CSKCRAANPGRSRLSGQCHLVFPDPAKCCGAGLQTCAGRPRPAVRDSATCKGRTRGPEQTWTSAPRKLSDIGLSGGRYKRECNQTARTAAPIFWKFVLRQKC